MGLCRKIWQQKEGPNMLELALCGWWWGLKGLVAKEKAWAWLTKRERKWKVNYRDLDEVTECWEGNSLMEGCLRLLSCSWDEVIEAQLLCTLPELKRSPLITQSDCVCSLALHTLTLVLNPLTQVWLNCDPGTFKTRLWDLLRNRQQSCVVREVSSVIPGSTQTLSLQDKMWMCRLNRNLSTHVGPFEFWHRGFHHLQMDLKNKTW